MNDRVDRLHPKFSKCPQNQNYLVQHQNLISIAYDMYFYCIFKTKLINKKNEFN